MYNGGLLIETRTPTVVTVSEMHAYKTCLFTNKCTVDMWWEILIEVKTMGITNAKSSVKS